MKQLIRTQAFYLIAFSVLAIPVQPVSGQNANLNVARANNAFAFDLFEQLRSDKTLDANILASPASISTALAMTYAGAQGTTADQMSDVLHLNGVADVHGGYGQWLQQLNLENDDYVLKMANRLFTQTGMSLQQPFFDTMSNSYNAPIERLDFFAAPEPARSHINDWVAENTNERIKDLLPSGAITEYTRVVLANATYLNAAWQSPFDEAMTSDQPFYQTDGVTIVTPAMIQTEQFRYGEYDGFKMVEMPYAGDDLSMVVVLPDVVDGIADVEAGLSAALFQSGVDALSFTNLTVALPAFRFRDEFSLKESLMAMGMTRAFSDVADFGGITEDERVQITDVFHKTFIDVTEKGTEAAAATGVVGGVTSVPPPPIPFRVDRPFLFAIRDVSTDGILFLGRVAEPEH